MDPLEEFLSHPPIPLEDPFPGFPVLPPIVRDVASNGVPILVRLMNRRNATRFLQFPPGKVILRSAAWEERLRGDERYWRLWLHLVHFEGPKDELDVIASSWLLDDFSDLEAMLTEEVT